MKSIYFAFFLLLLLTNCALNKERDIAYPSPAPDSVALKFLPGVVSSDSLDFNSAFSPDGKIFYFARTIKGKWVIYQVSLTEKGNTSITVAPFCESAHSQADPFVLPDGTIYYISNRPFNEQDTVKDYNIWRVRPQGNTTWSVPEYVEGVNTDSTEYYVSLAKNGNLYFASNRAGGYGGLDIYKSELVNGLYTTPVNLGAAVNTATDEHDPLITSDEKYLIFNSYNRPDGFGEADFYYSQNRGSDWTPAKNMGARFNTPTYEYCPNFSPDFRYFFFSSEYDVKWISSNYLPFPITE